MRSVHTLLALTDQLAQQEHQEEQRWQRQQQKNKACKGEHACCSSTPIPFPTSAIGLNKRLAVANERPIDVEVLMQLRRFARVFARSCV